MCDMIKPSFIPPADIRQFRNLMRYRFKLTNSLIGEKTCSKLPYCIQSKTRRCKHLLEEIQAAVEGAISHEQAVKLRECLNHIDELELHRSWAGYCPHNDQSGGKCKSTRISRAGAYIKPLLVQIANALIQSDKHPEFKERYRRIKARRGHKKAIIAICRMFLTAN